MRQSQQPIHRQPLYRKEALGGISASRLNRWNEKNALGSFEAGVDKGLKSWAALRAQLSAVKAGDLIIPETIPARVKYRSGLTYYGQTVRIMTGAFLSIVEEERARAAAEPQPPSLIPEIVKEKKKRNKLTDDDEDGDDEDENDDDEEEEDEEEEEEEEKVGLTRSASDPQLFREKNVIPPIVKIVDPKFPALSIAKFEHLLRTGSPAEVLLTAYNHFHWRYFDMALTAGFNIDTIVTGKTGKSLLFVAVENGDVERVEYLLSKGADANARDHRKDSMLHLCMNHPIIFHPKKIATLLLNSGANVNAQNKRGVTPLHRAVLLGFLDYVELFLKRRAKVFVFDNNKMMPLNYAGKNEAKVVKLMNQNVRFCGKAQHEMMWAYMMSRKFVPSIMNIVVSACPVCKRRSYECADDKKKSYRYWVYVHEVLGGKGKGK